MVRTAELSAAESCARQLTGWTNSIEGSPAQGKRHLTTPQQEVRCLPGS
jgi:hypothetical protein